MGKQQAHNGHGGARKHAGRKSFDELGLDARDERMTVRFTSDELQRLQAEARTLDISVAQLVAQRALAR
jgi:hypothetical protein